MEEKKYATRFTLQFSGSDPHHLQTISILNQQGRRKAQFIVNAVLHYQNCGRTPLPDMPAAIDIAAIEAMVERLVKESLPAKDEPAADSPMNPKPQKAIEPPLSELQISDCVAALGKEGCNAVANALGVMRRK